MARPLNLTPSRLGGRLALSAESFRKMDMEVKKVHMIGIGGSGMSGIALLLLAEGIELTGSDARQSPVTDQLCRKGARIVYQHTSANLPNDCQLVVISAAVKESNPELTEARKRGIEVYKYARMLGLLMNKRLGIAVSGTHGKTTTTSLVSFLLRSAGNDPSFVFGSSSSQLGGSSYVGRDRYLVVEACEYDRSFLNLKPEVAVVLNVESDHLDYYRDLEEIVETFGDFAALVNPSGLVVVNGCDENALRAVRRAKAPVETFGIGKSVDWLAKNLTETDGTYSFRLYHHGRDMGLYRLGIPGAHNVMNATAALAVACHFKLDLEKVETALASFRGVDRRFERLRDDKRLAVVSDYAHHPTEIRATLAAAREFYRDRRLVVVFQPHQHSRTRALLKDFERSFALADRVIVPDIYFVRDSLEVARSVTSEDLVEGIRRQGADAIYIPSLGEIVSYLYRALAPGDVLLCLGAGNVNEVAGQLVSWPDAQSQA